MAQRKNGRWYPAKIRAKNRDGSYTLDWESGERKELRQPEARLMPFSSTYNCSIPDMSAIDCEGAGGQPPGPAAAAPPSAGSPTLSELVSRDKTFAAKVLSSLGCVIPVEEILSVPRFLRVRASRHHGGDDAHLPISIDDIRNELRTAGEAEHAVEKVEKTALEDFVALPYAVGVAHLPCHLGGRVVGQDLSSGVAVRALLHGRAATESSSRAPCHALELCCAPGGKLWYLAELLLQGNDSDAPDSLLPGHCTVTGVDLSRQRLDQCRGAARRLGFRNVRLLEADARTFDEGPPAAEEFYSDVCRERSAREGGASLAHMSCLPPRKQAALKARLCRSRRLPGVIQGGREGPTSSPSEEERAKQESRHAILDALSLCERLARAASLEPACRERGADPGVKGEGDSVVAESLGASIQHRRGEALERSGQRQGVCSVSGEEGGRRGYDLVMVDAECSADGSIPHLRYMMSCALGDQGGGAAARVEAAEQRYRSAVWSEEAGAHHSGGEAFETQQHDGEVTGATVDCRETSGAHNDRPYDGDGSRGGLDNGGGSSGALRQLQGGLLRNGFRLLAPGGALVYVTCSSREEQNEGLVGTFLAQERRAALEHVETFGVPAARRGPGGNMALLGPETSGTSGLFIARVVKAR